MFLYKSVNLCFCCKVGYFNVQSFGTDSLMGPASSGHSRNCRLWPHFSGSEVVACPQFYCFYSAYCTLPDEHQMAGKHNQRLPRLIFLVCFPTTMIIFTNQTISCLMEINLRDQFLQYTKLIEKIASLQSDAKTKSCFYNSMHESHSRYTFDLCITDVRLLD